MQSLEASRNYKNSFVCAAKIFKDEGVLTFWSGAVPRLARLILSGGIVFTMCVHSSLLPPSGSFAAAVIDIKANDQHSGRYEKSMELLDLADPERKYL